MASSLQMTTLDQRGPYPGLCCFYPPDATSCDPEASGGCKSFGDPFEPTNWCHQNSGNCAACTPAGESPFRYCPKNHGMGCYAQAYPDLLKAFCQGKLELCDWSKLLDHWQKFGQAEGRSKDCPRATITDSPPPLTQPSLPRPPPSPPLLRASPATSPASSSALHTSSPAATASSLLPRPSSTKACASLGWHISISMVCGSSSAGMGGCLRNATWPEANARCQQYGARLCSLAELSATANTGCNYDTTKDVVWTSDSCSVGYEAALSRSTDVRTCDFAEKRNAVRCCADEIPQEAATVDEIPQEAAPVDHEPAQEQPASTPQLLAQQAPPPPILPAAPLPSPFPPPLLSPRPQSPKPKPSAPSLPPAPCTWATGLTFLHSDWCYALNTEPEKCDKAFVKLSVSGLYRRCAYDAASSTCKFRDKTEKLGCYPPPSPPRASPPPPSPLPRASLPSPPPSPSPFSAPMQLPSQTKRRPTLPEGLQLEPPPSPLSLSPPLPPLQVLSLKHHQHANLPSTAPPPPPPPRPHAKPPSIAPPPPPLPPPWYQHRDRVHAKAKVPLTTLLSPSLPPQVSHQHSAAQHVFLPPGRTQTIAEPARSADHSHPPNPPSLPDASPLQGVSQEEAASPLPVVVGVGAVCVLMACLCRYWRARHRPRGMQGYARLSLPVEYHTDSFEPVGRAQALPPRSRSRPPPPPPPAPQPQPQTPPRPPPPPQPSLPLRPPPPPPVAAPPPSYLTGGEQTDVLVYGL